MPGETQSVGSVYELRALRGFWLTPPAGYRYVMAVPRGWHAWPPADWHESCLLTALGTGDHRPYRRTTGRLQWSGFEWLLLFFLWTPMMISQVSSWRSSMWKQRSDDAGV